MQKHSSVPESNLGADSTFQNLSASTPGALQLLQLQTELWLERSLNQLQLRINECLVCAFTNQKTARESEAGIFQAVINELSVALGISVAIALADNAASEHSLISKPTCQICYIASTQQVQTELKNHSAVIMATGKTLQLKLAEVITLEDLEQLQSQKQQSAWSIKYDQGLVYWLITATPPCDLESEAALKAQLNNQVIEQSLHATVLALKHLKRLQAVFLQCKQLEARNRELVRINQLKSEFLANTSHEVRTPLSSILGFTHLLQAQGYSPDNLRHHEYLNIILSSGQHLLALINDILDMSKIEANQLEVQWENVDVPVLCHSVMALVKEKASDKGLALRLDLDPHATTIVADSLRLKQMLFNLLSNALKFTSQGTVGLQQVKHKDVFVHFTVWDTGIGISEEEQTQLFQPYSQIANVVAGRQEGTGLGLALTQKLAELQGGWVEVQSELNRGSRFTIVLPYTCVLPGAGEQREQGERRIPRPLPLARPSSVATAPIMLVEDNLHNAKLMTTYLKKLDYQVIWVKNAAQMWQALEGPQPALILMDVHLPDVDGLTLVNQLQAHEQYRTIPVIVQTAMAMKGDRETCLAAGAVDYISKPIDLKGLAQLVLKYSSATI